MRVKISRERLLKNKGQVKPSAKLKQLKLSNNQVHNITNTLLESQNTEGNSNRVSFKL